MKSDHYVSLAAIMFHQAKSTYEALVATYQPFMVKAKGMTRDLGPGLQPFDMDASAEVNEHTHDFWKTAMKMLIAERNMLSEMSDQLSKESPADAGSVSCYVETLDTWIEQLQKQAKSLGINI